MAQNGASFVDKCLIYYSHDDNCWVAHSLRTDQVGLGDGVVDALVDLMTGTGNLLAMAKSDPSIAIFRDAPEDIQKRAAQASPLSQAIIQIAYERYTNRLPKEYKVDIEIPKSEHLTAQLLEPVSV